MEYVGSMSQELFEGHIVGINGRVGMLVFDSDVYLTEVVFIRFCWKFPRCMELYWRTLAAGN